jgi:acetolactate synthase-1/2/3 large subunit
VPDGCQVDVLAGPGDDPAAALEALAQALGVPTGAATASADLARPARPTGPLTAQTLAAAIGAVLPDGAVVSDESNTGGLHIPAATAGCPPHDWLTLTGGAIGQGLPVATGAAVAMPDRPVLCLEADGSAMYTLQALWTQARLGSNVTTVIIDNQAYGILGFELARVGAGTPGPVARSMLELHHPELDFVALARGMGVPASRADSAEELTEQLDRAMAEPGPALIHAPIPPAM